MRNNNQKVSNSRHFRSRGGKCQGFGCSGYNPGPDSNRDWCYLFVREKVTEKLK